MFHLISHVVFQKNTEIYGPAHVLVRFLQQKQKPVNFVCLPLDLEGQFYIQDQQGKYVTSQNFSSLLQKYGYDLWYVLKYILNYRPSSGDTVIAVDPLNGLFFSLVKPLMGFRFIYYTADYSDNRFNNLLLDTVYKLFDWICLQVCDQNWCVSEAIVEKRKDQGYKAKAKFLPNTPILDDQPRLQKSTSQNKLIYVGRMEDNMKIWELIKAIPMILKQSPKTTLTLIGSGSQDDQIKTFIKKEKLSDCISFLGPLPNAKVIENLKEHGIGLALYSGGNTWNKYGDSMKIREYQYYGLPVMTTTIPSNSREITEYECGVVFSPEEVTSELIVTSIQKIQKGYNKFTKNTHKVALLRMKDKMFDDLLKL